MLDKTHDAKEIYLLNACDIPSHYHYVTMQTNTEFRMLDRTHNARERYIHYMLAIFLHTIIMCWIKNMDKNLRRSQANKVWTFRAS